MNILMSSVQPDIHHHSFVYFRRICDDEDVFPNLCNVSVKGSRNPGLYPKSRHHSPYSIQRNSLYGEHCKYQLSIPMSKLSIPRMMSNLLSSSGLSGGHSSSSVWHLNKIILFSDSRPGSCMVRASRDSSQNFLYNLH